MNTTVEELIAQALESLRECVPDPDIMFGPALEGALRRRDAAIAALERAFERGIGYEP